MSVYNYPGARAISKSMNFSFWFKPKSIEEARRVTRWHSLTEATNRAKEFQAFHPRLIGHHRPGFEKIKLRELYVRNYDQHKAAIFCLQIMGKKKVAIPLR